MTNPIKKLIYWFSNNNGLRKFVWIRILQCLLVGHHPKAWSVRKKRNKGWCSWCGRETSLSPRLRKDI